MLVLLVLVLIHLLLLVPHFLLAIHYVEHSLDNIVIQFEWKILKNIYLTTFYTSICWKCSCHNYHKIDIYNWNNYDHSNLECKSISNRMLFQNEVLLLWNLCMCMWGWFAMSGSLDQFKHVIYNLFGSVLQKPHFSLIHSGVFWAFILESLFWKFNLLLVAF